MKKLWFIFLYISLFAKMPEIVSIEWLKNHYNDDNLVIIDVRDKSEFKKSHLKKAVNIPSLTELFDKNNEMKLPQLSTLKDIFSEAGIDDKSEIVVYGGKNPIWGARFYWISEVLGHDNVGLLKVSFGNWKKGELPITTKIYKPKYTNFIPKVDNSKISTMLSTYLAINKDYIIDGRPYKFYIGKKSHAKRYGHIPSALNFPGNLTYKITKSGTFIKNFDSLEKVYKNLPKDKPIILYCEDGADASMNFLVLQKLGYKVSVYDGSWLEWGNDKNLPIEKKPRKIIK